MRLSPDPGPGDSPPSGSSGHDAGGDHGAVPASPWLSVESVLKRYGTATVLDGLSLQLHGHEFVCLLGPSGCGKTTLLRILCGIEAPDGGRVWLRGEDITALPAARRRFGVVFQSYALFPNLTALANVAYGLAGMERRHRERRAREMLDLVGLAAHADKYPAQLSGGQQQRVALARALAPKPQLLLLDEPLSALDAQVRVNLRSEIRAIQQRLRVPAIMVTHDQDEALAMADRVVLMHQGRIEQQAAPVDLYARPATGFAARFIGRINLFEGQAEANGIVRIGEVLLILADSVPAAGRVAVGIRPGHVRLHPMDLAAARAPEPPLWPANHLPARVTGLTFCGAWIGLHLHVPGLGDGAALEAEMPTPPDGRPAWQIGDPCLVEFPPAALRAIAA